MKPGRELDALVVEMVMDWDHQDIWDDEPLVPPDVYLIRLKETVPPYSTDIAAAWQVDRPSWVWEFQETSHDLTATLYPSPEARMEAVTSYPILPEGVTLASTYAWVRCLAALLAVGMEVENA